MIDLWLGSSGVGTNKMRILLMLVAAATLLVGVAGGSDGRCGCAAPLALSTGTGAVRTIDCEGGLNPTAGNFPSLGDQGQAEPLLAFSATAQFGHLPGRSAACKIPRGPRVGSVVVPPVSMLRLPGPFSSSSLGQSSHVGLHMALQGRGVRGPCRSVVMASSMAGGEGGEENTTEDEEGEASEEEEEEEEGLPDDQNSEDDYVPEDSDEAVDAELVDDDEDAVPKVTTTLALACLEDSWRSSLTLCDLFCSIRTQSWDEMSKAEQIIDVRELVAESGEYINDEQLIRCEKWKWKKRLREREIERDSEIEIERERERER